MCGTISCIRASCKRRSDNVARGNAYDDKGDYDSAIADLTQAIRFDPKNAHAYYFRGKVYQAKGQRAAAERDFAEAKRLGYKP